MKKPLVLLAIFSIASIFGTDSFEIDRGDGIKIRGYLDKPEKSPFSITLIIPGSQKETSLRTHDALKTELTEIGQCALTLEKQGIQGDQIDEKQFQKFLTIDDRVEDHLQLLQKLTTGLISGWDGKLSIIGQGDGGRIGAKLATKADHISALVLVASAGGWPPLEEALYSFRSEMVDDGYSPQYIQGFLVQAKQVFAQALKTPKTEEKAFGYTYKYWNSLLKNTFLNDLTLLKCPIYSVNGDRDDRVPMESVEAMAKHCKKNLKLVKKEEAGREIIRDPKTYQEAIAWLEGVL